MNSHQIDRDSRLLSISFHLIYQLRANMHEKQRGVCFRRKLSRVSLYKYQFIFAFCTVFRGKRYRNDYVIYVYIDRQKNIVRTEQFFVVCRKYGIS